jgi:hypothetical protein
MVLGMTLSTFTALHVLLSLVGIGAGAAVLFGMLEGKRLDRITAIFLLATALTSVTGYLFPFHHLLPSHIVGAISLVALAIAIYARYGRRMESSWRATYVITAMIAFYLNVFVLVVQAFLKIPALHALAPNGKEPPFAITQVVVLALFVGLTIAAVKRFRIAPSAAVPPAWTKTKAS